MPWCGLESKRGRRAQDQATCTHCLGLAQEWEWSILTQFAHLDPEGRGKLTPVSCEQVLWVTSGYSCAAQGGLLQTRYSHMGASLVVQTVKNLPTMQKAQVCSLG